MSSTARPVTFVGLAALAAVVLIVSVGLPVPTASWVILGATYLALRIAYRDTLNTGPAWLVLMATSAALDAPSAIGGVAAFVVLGVVVDLVRQSTTWRRRFLSEAVPGIGLALLVAVAGDLAGLPLFFVLAGATAGALRSTLARRVVAAGSPRWRTDVGVGSSLAASSITASAAALLGVVASEVGPLIVPLVSLALLALASNAFADRVVARAQQHTIRSLLRALEVKDLYTRGHGERVAEYARMTGSEMGISGARLDNLACAALLHDIGKVAVSRHLLRKRDRLDPLEYCIVQEHSPAAAELLAGIEFLGDAVPIVVEHHVHVDGSGYGAIHGSELSLEARILSVADAFDAMTTHRPYRRALSRSYAIAELLRHSQTQFDPQVVAAFVGAIERQPVLFDGGYNSDSVARLSALGVTDIPEVIHVSL
jgi:hypothetical protein